MKYPTMSMGRFLLPALAALLIGALAPVTAVRADSAKEIDAKVNEALKRLHEEVKGSEAITSAAKGVLVFSGVIKAGIGIGGEYGEGALRMGGKTAGYYSIASASVGLQLGAQKKDVIICFMEQKALEGFRSSSGWKAGVDGSVALVTVGAGGSVDTSKIKEPIVGFIVGQSGLMYNLTLEGSKISKLDKS